MRLPQPITPRNTNTNASASDENLIPLINIVFLILIFFLAAATLRPFTARQISPASSTSAEKAGPLTYTLMIEKSGRLLYANQPTTISELRERAAREPQKTTLTIVADKDLTSEILLQHISALNGGPFSAIHLITTGARP